MTPRRPFSAVVLTGGQSRRMGEDKALTLLHGRPLVSYPAQALSSAGATEVIAVGGDEARLTALGLRVVPDEFPGSGPLGGIIAGLEHSRESAAVVVGCDQPAITTAAIDELLGRLWASDAEVVLPVIGDRRSAIGGAYRVTAAARLRAAFQAGERSVHRAVETLSIELLVPADEDAFIDVDSPAELRRYAATDRGQRGKRG